MKIERSNFENEKKFFESEVKKLINNLAEFSSKTMTFMLKVDQKIDMSDLVFQDKGKKSWLKLSQ